MTLAEQPGDFRRSLVSTVGVPDLRNQHRQIVPVEQTPSGSADGNDDQIIETRAGRTRAARFKHADDFERHVSDPNGFVERIFTGEQIFLYIGPDDGYA